MSEDRSDLPPKIDRPGLDRIGRELRALYGELLQEPWPENLRRVVHRLEDANSGLSHLRVAAQALRRADQPSADPPASPWTAATGILRLARRR